MITNYRGFTLIELIIVLAVIGILAVAIFVAVNPAKRLGEAQNAIRDKNCEELEKCFSQVIEGNNYNTPAALTALSLNTPYMLVSSGGLTTGTTNCQSLKQDIARKDLASLMEPYIGTLPVDPLATTSNDTGYYVKRVSDSTFYVNHCYEYTATVVEEGGGDSPPPDPVCGNNIIEGSETCEYTSLEGRFCESLGMYGGQCSEAAVNCPGYESPASGYCINCGWSHSMPPCLPLP